MCKVKGPEFSSATHKNYNQEIRILISVSPYVCYDFPYLNMRCNSLLLIYRELSHMYMFEELKGRLRLRW